MDNILEKMAKIRYETGSTEEAIKNIFGDEWIGKSKKLRKLIKSILKKSEYIEKKYCELEIRDVVFQEIDEICGNDLSLQFCKLSDLKYFIEMRNWEISKDELKEQGMDIDFIKDMFNKVHETEQNISDEVTVDEINTLREELSLLLSEYDNINETLKQLSEDESWSEIIENVEETLNKITDDEREDFAVMVATMIAHNNSKISDENAASMASVYLAELQGKKKLLYVWLAIPVVSSGVIVGLLMSLAGGILNVPTLLLVGSGVTVVSGLILSGIVMAFVGVVGYKAVEKALPYIKKALNKCAPYIKKVTETVKVAVASAIGFMANKVFRPAIYWVENKAIPNINEKVVYPLRRRLKHLLEWLGEKKEQVIEFFKNAITPKEFNDNTKMHKNNVNDVNKVKDKKVDEGLIFSENEKDQEYEWVLVD
ncbi:hypothetical protein B5E58_12775 [Tyzzerella sp. An114]|uniref:sulfite exporter TauE/SafE family protein n=1 Tax=Tyzzerella sp. An114 TaxID=1965545 RepID=UPI000B42FF6F|nr:sulfite exporter TauE/SafE family protein [Tyzzerella sp. An114]OUQ55147.1 hypothetical protein B5E58_12775 [Tyzzerella sp. An114]